MVISISISLIVITFTQAPLNSNRGFFIYSQPQQVIPIQIKNIEKSSQNIWSVLKIVVPLQSQMAREDNC